MTPAQKMALVRRAWVSRQQADEAQARAEARASKVRELARGHAPPSVIADAAEAAALAFEEAAQASHEASVAFKVIVDAMGRDGLPDDASVADWLALPSEEDQVTR